MSSLKRLNSACVKVEIEFSNKEYIESPGLLGRKKLEKAFNVAISLSNNVFDKTIHHHNAISLWTINFRYFGVKGLDLFDKLAMF